MQTAKWTISLGGAWPLSQHRGLDKNHPCNYVHILCIAYCVKSIIVKSKVLGLRDFQMALQDFQRTTREHTARLHAIPDDGTEMNKTDSQVCHIKKG